MIHKLRRNEKNVLRTASSESLQDVFIDLRSNFTRDKWLKSNNRYLTNTIRKIKRDSSTLSSEKQKQLAQYIAASTVLHCSDGWNLLGRALEAHGRRDRDVAIHLGYYAELRATMALLSISGIGVFSQKHFVYDNSKIIKNVGTKLGTHIASWLFLSHWDNLQKASGVIGEIITPGGIKLSEWHEYFNPGSSFFLIEKEWLRAWGLDLRRLGGDREARNESSYRPTRLNKQSSLSTTETSSFINSFWRVCETSGVLNFSYIDRHLLRESLERVHKATTGKNPLTDPIYRRKIRNMLNSIPSLTTSSNYWKDFLFRSSDPATSLIIKYAQASTGSNGSSHHLEVLSRSTLLLRLSQGACKRLLVDSGVTRTELEFWWKPFGEERGLWEVGNEPDPFADLWADVDEALGNLTQWNVANPTTPQSFIKWRRECIKDIAVLTELERVALWGLGI